MEPAAPSNGDAAAKKRQRRPSVRLGEIGAAYNDPHRRAKQFKASPPQLHLDSFPGDQNRPVWAEENTSTPHWAEDSRERNSDQKHISPEIGFWARSGEDGSVRAWLNGLGLGRYVPIFQIHEVDDEVLPLLTLEDLKEMGITAVGSRRKIFFAIQQLNKKDADC